MKVSILIPKKSQNGSSVFGYRKEKQAAQEAMKLFSQPIPPIPKLCFVFPYTSYANILPHGKSRFVPHGLAPDFLVASGASHNECDYK